MKEHRIQNRLFSLAAALACVAATSLSPAHSAIAAPPAPPRDAKKVVYTLKAGSVKLDADNDQKLAPNQVKDFDVVATFINPAIARWDYGFVLRRQPGKGALVFLVDDSGDAILASTKDDFHLIKPSINVKSLKKNANEKNEIAIYARGDQVMAFINKVYVDTWTVSDYLDAGELALVAGSSDKEAKGEIKFTNFTVRTPPTAAPGAAVAPPAKAGKGNIVLTVQNTGYVQWGRPSGMDKPETGCSGFDDGRPVRQFQASVQIQNKGSQPIKDAEVGFFKPGGAPAFWCYYHYDGAGVEIPAGQARNITFAVFVELNESVESMLIVDKVLGESNRLVFK